jgi:hypothetical protein
MDVLQGVRGGATRDTQPYLGPHPTMLPGSSISGDRAKNAGGGGDRAAGALSREAFAYKVVAMPVKNILFLHTNVK